MAKRVFKINGSCKPLFLHIQEVSDRKTAEKICEEANANYYRLLRAHADLNKTAFLHWRQCCERAAIYFAVKKYYPESVMEWLNETLQQYGMKAGATLNRILHFPGMKSLFLPMMGRIGRSTFGPKGGFRNRFGVVNRQQAQFDILECPYCTYLRELGCPELSPGFCKSDEYVYGNLDAFVFERTQTLGTGGEKCDFCIRKRGTR